MSYSLNSLYQTIGISKQAVKGYADRQTCFDKKVSGLMLEADELRRAHPGCGVEKMYYTLKPDFIGRDRFVELFMGMGYRVKYKKNYHITTRGGDFYYPNLIEGLKVKTASVIWQSDITYIRVGERFYYAVFIIDVYTKKIVGYSLSDHMRATANLQALKMALKEHKAPQYHHSDRGSQYIYHKYTSLLKELGTKISMGKIAQENAYAERINGTIKNEFLVYWKPKTFGQLKHQMKKAVDYYNNRRPHNHLSRNTPSEFLQEVISGKAEREEITIFKFEHVN
jgi:transposase InsO family protein